MHMRTKALVLRAVDYKESDKILTLLTQESGKLTASARGCRKKGSPVAAGVQLLAWSDLVLYEYRGRWTVKEAAVEREFLGLRRDVERLALACYFAEAAEALAVEDVPAPELLSLVLNSLYALDQMPQKPLALVKAAFELRLMCAAGYEPILDGCAVCGAERPEEPRFHLREGALHCAKCRGGVGEGISMPVSPPVLAAMRHVVCGDARRLFSFRLDSGALEELAGVLKDTNAMVLSDEIYAELTYGQKHVSPANLPELYDRTIVVNGFSKSHAMTGWRMGYVCAPKPIIQCLTKLHQFGIMSAPTVSQYAAIEAMRNGDRDIEHMREEYDSRRRYLVENLRRIGLSCFEPKGAFYVFPDIRSTGLTSNEFCERFLREERVAVIPGSAFGPGGEGFVRACYAASMKDISEAITRMDNFLTNLRRSQGRG